LNIGDSPAYWGLSWISGIILNVRDYPGYLGLSCVLGIILNMGFLYSSRILV
jgi:hypothetical protein